MLSALSSVLSLLQAVAPAPAAPAKAPAPPLHDLVAIQVRDAATLDRILALDLDLASCHPIELPAREVEVLAEPWELRKIEQAGLRYRVLVRGIEDAIEAELAQWSFAKTLTPDVGKGSMGGNYTLAEMEAILDAFAKNFPALCTKRTSIGKTIENRDIWMVKISDNVQTDEAEPEVLFDAVHHAREPVGMTTTLLFMDWLLSNYQKDPRATYLVEERELYFVPCLNPDGYEYNRSIRPGGGGMWRKNRRLNADNSYGVDLNRNWPTGWGLDSGSSGSTTSETYRGPKALSEPETQALEAFIKSRNFTFGNSCHTYQELLLRPWGYQTGEPTNGARYKVIDVEAVKVSGMPAGPVSTLLYLASGSAIDHYHAVHGMFAYTPELGTSNEGGFWPNPTNQVAIAYRHQHMFQTFAYAAGAAVVMDEEAVLEGPGSNNNGRVEAGEKGVIKVDVRNFGQAACPSKVILGLVSKTTGVKVLGGSHDLGNLAAFTTVTSTTLQFEVDAKVQAPVAELELQLVHEGRTDRRAVWVPLVDPVSLVDDDFEADRGHVRSTGGTATTGLFERAAPQATTNGSVTAQPGADHTPAPGTLCWVTGASAGSSVGANDVDNGVTSFETPTLDLAHVVLPTVSFWLHYYESVLPGDPFAVEVSADDGQTWSRVWSIDKPTNGWQRVEVRLTGLPAQDKVRVRFSAQDLSASLVEACVDDLVVGGYVEAGATTLLGSGVAGTSLRVGMNGEPGALGLGILSAGTAKLTVPGVDGELLVDLTKAILLPALPYGTGDALAFDLPIPNDASLKNQTFWMQQLHVATKGLRLGNRQGFTVR
ncbi:MAG: M14 family zinc carboxypeptidase [Planctomycetota bacterium]